MKVSLLKNYQNNYINFKQTPLIRTASFNNVFFKGAEDVFVRSQQDIEKDTKTSECSDYYEPKTLKKLFSEKYKPTRRFNEDGYRVTTIIDRKTQEPVEAYIKSYVEHVIKDSYDECYEMYVKNPDGEDVLAGAYRFLLYSDYKVINYGLMTSYKKELYEGIGTRLHQLAVERAIQNNINSIYIDSIGNAFPFHYKSLFRAKPATESDEFAKYDIMNRTAKICGLSEDELKECLVESSQPGLYDSLRTYENMLKKVYLKNKKFDSELEMVLDGENFEYWKELAKKQPILLD